MSFLEIHLDSAKQSLQDIKNQIEKTRLSFDDAQKKILNSGKTNFSQLNKIGSSRNAAISPLQSQQIKAIGQVQRLEKQILDEQSMIVEGTIAIESATTIDTTNQFSLSVLLSNPLVLIGIGILGISILSSSKKKGRK